MTHRVAMVGVLAGCLALAAGLGDAAASGPKITPTGVGAVKLGASYSQLRARHLVGRIGMGCELAGPNARAASLSAQLKGTVDFTLSSPRRVVDISLRGGATARGVGIGATIRQIKAAFPKAKVDHSTDHTFALTLVRIPKAGGGRLQFGVSTKSHRVTLIGVPAIAFCE
jgi:hypothetical protein